MNFYTAMLLLVITQIAKAQPKTVEFKPTAYYRNFSHKTMPVLRIAENDTIRTESVDAGGFNKSGINVTERGNPLTGPFYIEGAAQGDILVISLTKVELNRNYATTVAQFITRSLPKEIIKPVSGRNSKLVKWTLDLEKCIAKPPSTYDHLTNFSIKLQPFLGCVGVAAPASDKEPLSYFAGAYGGNMDFYKLTTGASIYLPVFHEGALLYLGDGHAAQGDGEINGDALETSMEFTFVTRLIKTDESKLSFPRIEDSAYIAAMAVGKTLEDALKKATQNLLDWVQEKYQLSILEATQVIGPLIEYRIPTLAGPKLEVAAMIKKEALNSLSK